MKVYVCFWWHIDEGDTFSGKVFSTSSAAELWCEGGRTYDEYGYNYYYTEVEVE